jgi:hypothetical protein
VLVIVDNVAGITSAAPSPSTPRMAISQPGPLTDIAAMEPAPNTAKPATSARRRPYRSPMAPPSSNSAANTSA